MRPVASIVALLFAAACTASTPTESLPVDELLDVGAFVDVGAGDAVEFEVRGIGPGSSEQPTPEQFAAAVGLARLRVAPGQKVVVTMRAHAPSFDSYLLLLNEDLEVLASSDFQAAMPAQGSDSLITILPADEERVFLIQGSGSKYLTESGRFTIDVIEQEATSVTLGLPVYAVYDRGGQLALDPELSDVLAELAEVQPQVESFLEIGYLEEDQLGELSYGPEVPIDRRLIKPVRDRANELRSELFSWHMSETVDRRTVADACLTLWSELAPLTDKSLE